MVGYPTETAYPSVQDSLRQSVLLFFALISITGVLAFGLSKQLARPIKDLTRSAQAISDGNLDQQVFVQGGSELRQLARAFNTMSGNLKQKMEELAAAKEEISQKAEHLRLLLTHTISLQEEERQRIACEIHDGISQYLLAALYETEAAKESLTRDPSLAMADLSRAQALLEQTSTEMRRVIYDLRPPLLDDIGFLPTLDHYIKNFSERTGIVTSLNVTGSITRLPPDDELALYRISQEALHNIHQHAQTDTAEILVDFHDHRMTMTIQDHGVGFDQAHLDLFKVEHMGLPGMRERAESIGADLAIHAVPGSGTTVQLILPIQ